MNRDFFSEIVSRKRTRITNLSASAKALRERARRTRDKSEPHRLRRALDAASPAVKIIAEFKRRSPSRGLIRADLSPADAARAYERGGACAISVLTDEEYFDGSLDDLNAVRSATRLSILRKDFVVDAVQIYEAAMAGADAVLLIAAILNDGELTRLRAITEDELGLDALVEVHSSEEMRRAQNTGATLIGVNNRDLRTLEVSLITSERLIAEAPAGAALISESGFQTAEQLRHLQALGFRGFLIGEALMQSSDPAAAVAELMK